MYILALIQNYIKLRPAFIDGYWRLAMSRLTESVERLVLDYITKLELSINFGSVRSFCWSNEDANLLRALVVGTEVLSREDVKTALDTALRAYARRWYEEKHLVDEDYPDHSWSTGGLAYALKHNEFTNDELEKIRFDHDETPESFARTHGLALDQVLDQLMKAREPLSAVSDVCLEAGH